MGWDHPCRDITLDPLFVHVWIEKVVEIPEFPIGLYPEGAIFTFTQVFVIAPKTRPFQAFFPWERVENV